MLDFPVRFKQLRVLSAKAILHKNIIDTHSKPVLLLLNFKEQPTYILIDLRFRT